jgi:Ca-activated chloride channel family protein
MRLYLYPVILIMLAGYFSAFGQDDDDVIKVDSSIVVLNASITDAAGKPVRGLDKKLFHVLEDGVEQAISAFDTEETPFAAVILIDASGSMERRISLARSAAIEFLDRLRASDQAALYKFDSKVTLLQDFSNSRDVNDHIFDVKADGMTALNDAVFNAAAVLSGRAEKRRAIIVLSDGADTSSKRSSDKALKAALAANAMIYTVDMSDPAEVPGRGQNQGVLRTFAEKTGGRFIATPGGLKMREAFELIVAELGTQYTLSYTPTNTKRDGKWRALELRVSRPNLTIRTRKGYNSPK